MSDLREEISNAGISDLSDMRLIEYLVQEKSYDLSEVLRFISPQLSSGIPVSDLLKRSGMIKEWEVIRISADLHNMEPVTLTGEDVEIDIAKHLFTAEQAGEWKALPFSRDDMGRLRVALSSPASAIRDEISKALPREDVVYCLASEEELATWIERIFDPATSGALNELVLGGEGEEGKRIVVREPALDSRIIQLVDEMIDRAYDARASDIHIEPKENFTEIRFRIDGVLRKVSDLQRSDTPRVVARIKTMSQMRVDEQRMPQDGRATTKAGASRSPLDLRVVSAPTIYGEQVSMRLLDPTQAMLTLEQLGMSADNLQRYMNSISKAHGVCLVVGPTGSGKSTTLYSSLARVITPTKKIISIEDPVEYRMQGIVQMDVSGGNPKFGFAQALRSILRADPDIIMVGEIRDTDTAQIAVDASLTGHFLYSTLHTNSALGTISRLQRIGVDPFLVAEALEVIVAQRLIRKLCTCKIEQPLDQEALAMLHAPAWALADSSKVLYRANPQGCQNCGGQGYLGRTGVHEVVEMTDDLRAAIVSGAPAEDLERIVRSTGIMSLRDDAMQKVWAGITSIEEMGRVTA